MLDDGERLVPGLPRGARAAGLGRRAAAVRGREDGRHGHTRDVSRAHALLDHRERDGVPASSPSRAASSRPPADGPGHRRRDVRAARRRAPVPHRDETGCRGPRTASPTASATACARARRSCTTSSSICECELVGAQRGSRTRCARRGTTNLDDIRRTLRLGMGPCQGGFCIYRAAGHPARRRAARRRRRPTGSLRHFLQERWKGVWPVLYGDQLRQARLDDWIFQGAARRGAPARRDGRRRRRSTPSSSRRRWHDARRHRRRDRARRPHRRGPPRPGRRPRRSCWPRASAPPISAGATIDVLGYAPGAGRVARARRSPRLAAEQPDHPYARLGAAAVGRGARLAGAQVAAGPLAPYAYEGGLEREPPAADRGRRAQADRDGAGDDGRRATSGASAARVHRRLPPAQGLPSHAVRREPRARPRRAVEARGVELDLPVTGRADVNALGHRRSSSTTRRSAARSSQQLAGRLHADERVGLPAVLGLRDPHAVWADLEHRLGRPVFEIPTLPPSVPGHAPLHDPARRAARAPAAARSSARGRRPGSDGDRGWRGCGCASAAARRSAGPARSCSPRAASPPAASRSTPAGTRARRRSGCRSPACRRTGAPRFVPGYFDDQPMSRAGIAVDDELRPLDAGGEPVYENVRVAGASLAGAVPWKEKSGDGISLASGHRAAGLILQSERRDGRRDWRP